MAITLSDRARRFIARFEETTGATARDCVFEETHDRVLFVVAAGEMGQAIGPGGQRVQALEAELGRTVKLIEHADTPEAFVANALRPAAVYNVTVSEGGEGDDRIAYAEVAEEDRGAAIGADGRNIAAARTLAERHYDIADIQLT